MVLKSVTGSVFNASRALNIGSRSVQSGSFTSMVNAVSAGTTMLQGINQLAELTASTAVIALSIVNRFNSLIKFNTSYDQSPYKRFNGGVTYRDFKGTEGETIQSVVCTSSTPIQHMNDDGTVGKQYTVIKYSGKKASIVDPDAVVEEPPVEDFTNLYWDLLSFFKSSIGYKDVIPWNVMDLLRGISNTFFEIPRWKSAVQAEAQSELSDMDGLGVTNKVEWKVDKISNLTDPPPFKPVGSSNIRLHIYRKDNPDSRSGNAAEFYCVSPPINLSYSSTASYDEENVRGSQVPYRFYSHQEGRTISFSVDLHQQEYSAPLQKLVDIATDFTRPYSNGEYALKQKVVVVELPGLSFEGYCTEVRVDYSSEHGWYDGGEIENAGFGSVTLDFSFSVLENVLLQKTGVRSGFLMEDSIQTSTYRSTLNEPDYYMMAPMIVFE